MASATASRTVSAMMASARSIRMDRRMPRMERTKAISEPPIAHQYQATSTWNMNWHADSA